MKAYIFQYSVLRCEEKKLNLISNIRLFAIGLLLSITVHRPFIPPHFFLGNQKSPGLRVPIFPALLKGFFQMFQGLIEDHYQVQGILATQRFKEFLNMIKS